MTGSSVAIGAGAQASRFVSVAVGSAAVATNPKVVRVGPLHVSWHRRDGLFRSTVSTRSFGLTFRARRRRRP